MSSIADFQADRLRRVVEHAYERVPLYRRLFDEHGVRPDQVRGPEDLALLPMTDRRTLQASPVEDLLTEGVDRSALVVHRTSGSTGAPLTVLRAPLEEAAIKALRARALAGFGVRWKDRRAAINFVRGPGGATDAAIPEPIVSPRSLEIDCRLPPRRIAQELLKYRPDVIGGYAGTVARVASVLTEEERETLRPRFVVTSAEVLTPSRREQISKGFGAPVFDAYVCHELGWMATECPHGHGLHVVDDGLLLEVVDEDGRPAAQGERGQVVGTSLHAFTMPFIRYRLGDAVTRGPTPCPCGEARFTIASIQGRVLDYFTLPDGRSLHPYEIVRAFVDRPWLGQYRLTQERVDRVTLTIAALLDPPEGEAESMRARVQEVVGPGVEVSIELVPEIQPDPSGKSRVARSLVGSGHGAPPDLAGRDLEDRASHGAKPAAARAE